MTKHNEEKKEPIYLNNGHLVLDTIQQRMAAEMSLQKSSLFRQKEFLKREYHRLRVLRAEKTQSWKIESSYQQAKTALVEFYEKIVDPIRKPRTIQELQTDLKELESISKTLSVTDPEYATLLDYIEVRTTQINKAQAALTERYEAGLQALEKLSVEQGKLSTEQAKTTSPWEGKWDGKPVQNSTADLYRIFSEKKHLMTEDSVALLERTLTLLKEKPKMSNTIVEQVKTELAQQEQAAKSASITSPTTKETLNTEEKSTQKPRM